MKKFISGLLLSVVAFGASASMIADFKSSPKLDSLIQQSIIDGWRAGDNILHTVGHSNYNGCVLPHITPDHPGELVCSLSTSYGNFNDNVELNSIKQNIHNNVEVRLYVDVRNQSHGEVVQMCVDAVGYEYWDACDYQVRQSTQMSNTSRKAIHVATVYSRIVNDIRKFESFTTESNKHIVGRVWLIGRGDVLIDETMQYIDASYVPFLTQIDMMDMLSEWKVGLLGGLGTSGPSQADFDALQSDLDTDIQIITNNITEQKRKQAITDANQNTANQTADRKTLADAKHYADAAASREAKKINNSLLLQIQKLENRIAVLEGK